MLSREDMLRELELLPVWQLRNPTPVEKVPAPLQPQVPSQQKVAPTAVVTEPSQLDALATTAPQFRYVVSQDEQWGFVLPLTHDEAAETLLQNMLKAVSVTVGQNIADANNGHLTQHPTQLIVAMGEQQAQTVLSCGETLAQLRGKTHNLNNVVVIATYAPSDLLVNVQDKVGAWEDLCLAKFTIANL